MQKNIFYIALIFGYGLTLLFFFAIGRFGITQIIYVLKGYPSPDESKRQDQIDALFEAFGIPASLSDAMISLTPVAPVKTFITILKPFYSVWGGVYAYIAPLFGRFLGTTWLFVGIPAIVLNLVLDANGHDYLPEFLRLVGLTAFSLTTAGAACCFIVSTLPHHYH
ncbi:MAG: hypothetical protein DM484_21440 [Candidatus Methylumidiphilus alinenensis]|uniref:Uncharacterized protein n=1 Tax=Candidatus Methylumidiphilus alinenensis TaxID=2202197 RepID=A0A2W4SFX4_9GAMM|nr:MAG: hypothetical protein DM484_21440 [Candidatus Methylumidiphilus alinenensis]